MKIQLVVYYMGHLTRYFPIPPGQGWRVDADTRELKVGSGIPRTIIPLDRVLYYEVVEY